jgi:hypothetical protein
MPQTKSDADFMMRLAARFLKDPAISADAKALRARWARRVYFLP